jgi:hypothetical protein
MAKANGIHWATPVWMFCAFIAGLLFALGHHLFYTGLAGTEAPTGAYTIVGADISRQQLNTAVGTAFGFLVKSCLVLVISISFVQVFWNALRSSKEGGPSLSTLDSASGLLTNYLGFFEGSTWREFQMPLLLALIAWLVVAHASLAFRLDTYTSNRCVPMASIITPATLSVKSASISPVPTSALQVPNLGFATLNFVAPIPRGPDGFCFNGPSQAVQRVVAAVTARGEMLAMPAPAPNASWELDFWAPSLRCQHLAGDERGDVWANILDQWGEVTDYSYAPGYLAWTPSPESYLPFIRDGDTTKLQSPLPGIDYSTSIYIATLPQFFNFLFMSSNAPHEKGQFFGKDSLIYTYPIAEDLCLPGLQPPECYGQAAWATNATLLRCDVKNSSYSTQFDYTNGLQSIKATTDPTKDSVPLVLQQCFDTPGMHENRSNENSKMSNFDTAASQLLSYQSIIGVFHQTLLGSISMGGYGRPINTSSNTPYQTDIRTGALATTRTPGATFNTSIGTTILMDTEDLAFVANFNGVNDTFMSLQMQIDEAEENKSEYQGMTNKQPTGTRGDLKSALETLFQNITISLMADEYLRPNYSSPHAPAQLTKVTFHNNHNIYLYSWSTLWIAYGSALFFTFIAMLIGLLSMLKNNVAYANNFSTVLRVAKTATMDVEILDGEGDGRQPLPVRLAKARVQMSLPEPPTVKTTLRPSVKEDKTAPTAATRLLSE